MNSPECRAVFKALFSFIDRCFAKLVMSDKTTYMHDCLDSNI